MSIQPDLEPARPSHLLAAKQHKAHQPQPQLGNDFAPHPPPARLSSFFALWAQAQAVPQIGRLPPQPASRQRDTDRLSDEVTAAAELGTASAEAARTAVMRLQLTLSSPLLDPQRQQQTPPPLYLLTCSGCCPLGGTHGDGEAAVAAQEQQEGDPSPSELEAAELCSPFRYTCAATNASGAADTSRLVAPVATTATATAAAFADGGLEGAPRLQHSAATGIGPALPPTPAQVPPAGAAATVLPPESVSAPDLAVFFAHASPQFDLASAMLSTVPPFTASITEPSQRDRLPMLVQLPYSNTDNRPMTEGAAAEAADDGCGRCHHSYNGGNGGSASDNGGVFAARKSLRGPDTADASSNSGGGGGRGNSGATTGTTGATLGSPHCGSGFTDSDRRGAVVGIPPDVMYGMPELQMRDVARALGISAGELKRCCRVLGIQRWPRQGREAGGYAGGSAANSSSGPAPPSSGGFKDGAAVLG